MTEERTNLKFPEALEKTLIYGDEASVYPQLLIRALGEPNAGGGHCNYDIFDGDNLLATLNFQNGPISQGQAANGIIDEALLTILIHRAKGFQNGPFADAHGMLSLRHLEDALHRKEMRKNERKARGVLGKHEK